MANENNSDTITQIEKPLNTDDVATMLGVDGRTVQRLVQRGELTAFKAGRQFRYKRAEVEAYIQRNTIGRGAETNG